ncbi:molybdopterin-binding protein [Subtercola lobariae]|uniref:Molybdopterin molybdenumtransferase n=1 Tax=Subtercola lobariae TaxID=1588641 RepID=A0A917AYW0_9MICO|nr:molybdopterin-binding protein [Subtercola lobariae]GGF10833.1 molybdopterin molybdenumtransferase MoeA [Subtercola lobariae]
MAISADAAIRAESGAPVEAESVPIAEALGRVTAAAVQAAQDVPHFASSAMDGWAVAGSGPWVVIDVAAPSTGARGLRPGHATPIVTGAVIPPGTTAVLRSEHAVITSASPALGSVSVDPGSLAAPTEPLRPVTPCAATPGASATPDESCEPATARGHLAVSDAAKPGEPFTGQHIRRAGEEAAADETVIASGTLLNPAHIALAALAGRDELSVRAKPRVRFVFSGDEVDSVGVPQSGRVRDTFGPQLPALLEMLGARVLGQRRVGDTLSGTVETLAASIRDAQLVITTGGTGRSSADHLRDALNELDATVLFDGIAVRPGGPTLLARAANGCVVACLPGNPLAAMVGLVITVVPLVRGLGGRASGDLAEVTVGADIAGSGPSALLVPYSLADALAYPSAWRGSAMMRGLADADGLLEVPTGGLRAGQRAIVIGLPWREPALQSQTVGALVSNHYERDIMKISARNQLKGTIVEVTKGATTSHVRIDIGGSIVTASITNEAVDELGLVVGADAYAVVKASDVMVAVD